MFIKRCTNLLIRLILLFYKILFANCPKTRLPKTIFQKTKLTYINVIQNVNNILLYVLLKLQELLQGRAKLKVKNDAGAHPLVWRYISADRYFGAFSLIALGSRNSLVQGRSRQTEFLTMVQTRYKYIYTSGRQILFERTLRRWKL